MGRTRRGGSGAYTGRFFETHRSPEAVIPSLLSGQALSAVKDLRGARREILHCAQHDTSHLAGSFPKKPPRVRLCWRMREIQEWYNSRKQLAKRASGRSKSMSMYPQALGSIPEETVRIARAACPKGTLAMRLRDTLGELYQDEHFTTLYPAEGQPAYSPWRLAIVTVLQYAAGLTDRQAADAVRERIDWKYALALELTDPGFDFSLLSEFRLRLVEGGAETLLLDRLLEVCKQRGWRKRRRQATHRFHACL